MTTPADRAARARDAWVVAGLVGLVFLVLVPASAGVRLERGDLLELPRRLLHAHDAGNAGELAADDRIAARIEITGIARRRRDARRAFRRRR